MRSRWWCVLSAGFVAMVVAVTGCGGDDGVVPGTDSGTREDGGIDGGMDGGTDGGTDAGPQLPPPRCRVGACENGIARTCDANPVIVECGSFGASCADQEDFESGEDFRWCDCGDIEERDGQCIPGSPFGLACFDGLAGLVDCGPGFECEPREAAPFGIGCRCNDLEDDVCPSGCPDDPDCDACTPDCDDRSCGDNGCGGVCGVCDLGKTCDGVSGECVTECVPYCDPTWECGEDECGNSCGECTDGSTCNTGTHECEGPCIADCTLEGGGQRECGSDGCGGTCGTCTAPLQCSFDAPGQCRCDFFDTLTYSFDGSGLDFDDLFAVHVFVEHQPVGELPTSRDRFDSLLVTDTPTVTKRLYGCIHDAEVRLVYFVRGTSGECETSTRLTSDSLVIPAPTIVDGDCTAPTL